jgi:hypothetical protein
MRATRAACRRFDAIDGLQGLLFNLLTGTGESPQRAVSSLRLRPHDQSVPAHVRADVLGGSSRIRSSRV